MGLLSTIGNFISPVTDFIKPIVGDIFGDVSSAYLTDQIISRPQASDAFNQSLEGMRLQNQFNTAHATTAYQRSKEEAINQFNRESSAYRQRYQWTMDDMKKAGLNPILAASGGFNVGSGPDASMANIPMAHTNMATGVLPHYPQAGSSALRFSQSAKERKTIDKLDSDIKLNLTKGLFNLSKAKEAIVNISKIRAERNLLTAKEKSEVQRAQNLVNEFSLLSNQIKESAERAKLLNSQTHLAEAEIENVQAIARKNRADLNRVKALTAQLEAGLVKLQKTSNVYKGVSGTILTWIQEILRTLNPIVAGTAGAIIGKGLSNRSRAFYGPLSQ